MAKQHFYARVPAKLSLYNRMDGYDTFAVSDGISRELINGEIGTVCSVAPAKADLARIQRGELPPAFCHQVTEDGTVVQSAISFLSSDYTGERTAYMVHSLVLSPEEKHARMENDTSVTLDPSVFKTDLSDFDLTAADGKPDTEYPEIVLPACAADDTAMLAQNQDIGMMKRLIYALISISCKKAKALYLSLPAPAESFSRECLNFLNTVLCIFPYHMRSALSFITYTGDITKYSSCKIRCVPENTPAIPASKGISLKMGAQEFTGITDQVVAVNAVLVDFFFLLLQKSDMRKEFLAFCESAVTAVPALGTPSLKNLGDLVFLFRCQSGFFEEKQVLPTDDAIYNYLTVYGKNRDAIPEKYRAVAMKCLERYPANRAEMPKNIFAKVSSLYAEEPAVSKATVMTIVLQMIHTDAMREKLFGFINTNYLSESAKTRAEIMENLCRVYYGGFLQRQSLEFFTAHFAEEPVDTRRIILEKLLLTIRTPQVQPQVLAFLDAFFPTFNEAEKDLFYATFYEMLPEGDALSRSLADLVDRYIEDDRKDEVTKRVLSAVSADQRRKEPKICAALSTRCGFIQSILVGKIFTEWTDRAVFTEFCRAICQNDITTRMQILSEIWTAVPDLNKDTADRLLSTLEEDFNKSTRPALFELIAAIDAADEIVKTTPAATEFIAALKEKILYPDVQTVIPTAFDLKRYPDGLEKISELAKTRSFLSDAESYAPVAAYFDVVSAIEQDDRVAVLTHATRLPGKALRAYAAEHLNRRFDKAELPAETRFAVRLAILYLKEDFLQFTGAANDMRDKLIKATRAAGEQTDTALITKNADEKTAACVLSTATALFRSELPAELHDSIVADGGDLSKYLNSFVQRYDKKGKKFLTEQFSALSLPEEIVAVAQKSLAVKAPSSGGFFRKLFH